MLKVNTSGAPWEEEKEEVDIQAETNVCREMLLLLLHACKHMKEECKRWEKERERVETREIEKEERRRVSRFCRSYLPARASF